MRDGCPFCDYAGPSPILADYGDVFVIAPLRPVVIGHVLAIPRRHVATALANPQLTGRVATCAAIYARNHLSTHPSCNFITSVGRAATQTVRHLHWHLVPRSPGDGLALPWPSH